MSSHDVMRRFYASLVAHGAPDPRILDAFATIRRGDFMGPGPWKIRVDDGYLDTDTDDPIVLHQDVLVALSADRGIHNGQPVHWDWLVAVDTRAQ